MARPKRVEDETLDEAFNVEQVPDDTKWIPKDVYPVEAAYLYATMFVPGLSPETNLTQAKFPGIRMFASEKVLYCIARGKKFALPLTACRSWLPK